ncbi:hypothetical protein KY290_027815 [Solanum tuberosum]|uniref:DUF4218 domain-containing protein n=1 Tax=Solanum tuberosum TaxID=4113 RepID=A0ABQ7UHX5_SOLTU|nr:hypothetical protein KY290_027815 [Solanum tuberosum]
MGHRRFLPLNHKWMNDKKSFDGTVERRLPPNTLSGDDILDQVADLDGLPLTNDQKKKLFIRNRSCVEGSIAEGYIANEFTTFCSRYLHTMETKFNLLERNDDGVAVESNGGLMIFCQPGKALKGGKPHLLDLKEMEQAHIYILKNCDEVQPFLEEFSQIPGDSSKKNWIGNSSVGLKKSSKNLKQSFLPPSALVRGRGQSLKSMGSVRVTAEKRNLIDQMDITLETLRSKSEKDIGNNFTYGGSVKGSIVRGSVEMRTMIGNNKGLSSATYNQNIFAQKTNVVPPGFDALEDETSFPSDNLEVMQETVRSKPAKENGQNMTYVCSIKGSIVRGSVEKRTMIENNKGLNAATYNQNDITQKTNVVPPCFDALEDETSFPNDDLEVMQETVKSKPAKENRKNITSVWSVKESIVRGSV